MPGSATQVCLNVSQYILCINESNISVAPCAQTTPWIGASYGARCVLFFGPSGKRGALFSLRVQIYIFSSASKKYEPLSDIMLLYQDYCWPGKNTNEFNYVMKFIVRPSSKFQFAFGFNECLWEIFFLLNFENLSFYISVVVVWLLILPHE